MAETIISDDINQGNEFKVHYVWSKYEDHAICSFLTLGIDIQVRRTKSHGDWMLTIGDSYHFCSGSLTLDEVIKEAEDRFNQKLLIFLDMWTSLRHCIRNKGEDILNEHPSYAA